ncbi:MAG: hypothetical protein O7G30_07365, partial [Proteobacteria bacterium]|nr:hypothetical protein [Pseudomonadota bacterium]
MSDDGFEDSRRFVLEWGARQDWRPNRAYPPEQTSCFRISTDALGILASLELHRRGWPNPGAGRDVTPELADPWLAHMARSVPLLMGRAGGVPGPCADVAGPTVMIAAARVGQILLRFPPADGWSPELRAAARIMVTGTRWKSYKAITSNQLLALPIMHLELGEALCDAALWDSGVRMHNDLLRGLMERGGYEVNAIHYSHHHYGLLFALLDLEDPVLREQARLVLEYFLLANAHLYLPGGGLLPPYFRSRHGGLRIARHRADSLGPPLFLLSQDPEVDLRSLRDPHSGLLGPAVTDYRMPEIIRSIFLETGGYEWGARIMRNVGTGRSPHMVYPRLSATGRGSTFPWQVRVLPGARAGFGLSHGYPVSFLAPISSGVHVRCPRCEGGWAVLFQQQVLGLRDTDDVGQPLFLKSKGPDRDMGRLEGYDYAGQIFHDTVLRLWDPLPRPSRSRPGLRVKRERPFTVAYLPNWSRVEIGGRTLESGWPTPGGWYVGSLSDVHVGFRPLGVLGRAETSPCGPPADRDFLLADGRSAARGYYHVLCLLGRSGGVVVLENASESGRGLEAFAADLDGRHVFFQESGAGGHPVAEFDARDERGRLCRMRLEYKPTEGD